MVLDWASRLQFKEITRVSSSVVGEIFLLGDLEPSLMPVTGGQENRPRGGPCQLLCSSQHFLDQLEGSVGEDFCSQT